MSDGANEGRFQFDLQRLLFWIAIVGVWLAAMVEGRGDAVHGKRGFSVLMAALLIAGAVVGPALAAR